VSCLARLHYLADAVPGFRGLICRKTRESLTESALATFEAHIVQPDHAILKAGGQRRMRQAYNYPNGSSIVVGGLDKPGKIFSTEWDMVYVQEAIEFREDAWEAIITRLRNNKLPYQQIMADTNPDAPTHWIKRRQASGSLVMLESRHEDNPAYYDPRTGWTPKGSDYLARLEKITGVRYLRLRRGLWVQAEGVVYSEYDPHKHLIHRFEIPFDWDRYWTVDFGFTNAFVCQFWARDHDGRLYRYREVYHTKRIVADHAKRMLHLLDEECGYWARKLGLPVDNVKARLRPKAVICDHDREDRETLTRELGMPTTSAKKVVKRGIDAVQARFRDAPDGKPRLFLLEDSLDERDPDLVEAKLPIGFEEEVGAYVWDGEKDEPVKEGDHACLVAGTMVTTLEGLVPIEQVKVGCRVLTRKGYRRVLASGMTSDSAEVITVYFDNNRTLTGTANHPVYVPGYGFRPIESLRHADRVSCDNSYARGGRLVVMTQYRDKPVPVYNLTVEDEPEFYANGVLVHNCDALRYMVAHLDLDGPPEVASVAGPGPKAERTPSIRFGDAGGRKSRLLGR